MSKKKHKNKRPQPRPDTSTTATATQQPLVEQEELENEGETAVRDVIESEGVAVSETPSEDAPILEAPSENAEVMDTSAPEVVDEPDDIDEVTDEVAIEQVAVTEQEPSVDEESVDADAVAQEEGEETADGETDEPTLVSDSEVEAVQQTEDSVAQQVEEETAIAQEEETEPEQESEEDVETALTEVATDEQSDAEVATGEQPDTEGGEVTLTDEERRAAEEEALRRKEEARRKEEKLQKRKERRQKCRAWAKKHAAFIAVTSVIVAILLGLTIGFLIVTRDMAFVGKPEALDKALQKGKEVVLTADFTYTQNINGTSSINLNKHTLTVEGTVTLTADQGYIGSKAHPWANVGGKGGLVCQSLTLAGSDWTLNGNIDTPVVNYGTEGLLRVYGTVTGGIVLQTQSNLELYGTTTTVDGGLVTVYGGSKAKALRDSVELILYPNADIGSFNTAEYYYVYTLDTPTVWVVDNGEVYTCVIAGAAFARQYRIVFAGEEKATLDAPLGNAQLTYDLPSDVAPGTYTLQVVAINEVKANHCLYQESAPASVKVKYYADLAQPVINVEKEGDKYWLVIHHVDNATQFVYSINGGKEHKVNADKEGDTKEDITAYLNEVGNYLITVVAKHPKSNYNDSQKASITQLITHTLDTPTVDEVVLSNGEIKFKATVDANTTCLSVVVKQNGATKYSAQCSVNAQNEYVVLLPDAIDADQVIISAVGTRYYTDSVGVTMDVRK